MHVVRQMQSYGCNGKLVYCTKDHHGRASMVCASCHACSRSSHHAPLVNPKSPLQDEGMQLWICYFFSIIGLRIGTYLTSP